MINKNEPVLMGNYAKSGTPIYMIDERIRYLYKESFKKGFNSGVCEKLNHEISDDLMLSAKFQASEIRLAYDEPAFIIFQALKRQHFGKDKNLLMIINGNFEDVKGKRYSVTIPFSLESNPYQIYKSLESKKSIDAALTDMSTMEFLGRYQNQLQKDYGFKYFTIKSSNFFYIPQDLTDYFKNDLGEVNFENLIPFLYGGSNFIATTTANSKKLSIQKLEVPSLDVYLNNFFPFISSRHKISPVNKMMRKFNNRDVLIEKDMIADWFAMREVNVDRDVLDGIQSELSSTSVISLGNNKFFIEDLLVKDYFKNPKKEGFEAYVNNIIVRNKKLIFPIEYQGQIAPNYHRFELSKSSVDPTSRDNKDKRREKARSKGHIGFNACIRNILEKIYGQPQTKVNIRNLKAVPT